MSANLQKDLFYQKVEMIPFSTCHWWLGAIGKDGYGITSCRRQKTISAHRLSYEIFKGNLEAGKVVMHSCDNPACVNPDHLSLGTQRQNVQDCSAKGRINRGQDRPAAKLTDDQVIYIKSKLNNYYYGLGREIAKMFGIDSTVISRIEAGKAWKHL